VVDSGSFFLRRVAISPSIKQRHQHTVSTIPSVKKRKARTTKARNAPTRLKCSTPGCNCCTSNTSRLALYRNDTDGKLVFTGMACPVGGEMHTDAVRLDDTWGDLNGPGKKVSQCEFASQMSFYADSTLPFKPKVPLGLLTPIEASQFWDKVLSAPVDESEVRAGDTVQIACTGGMPCCNYPVRERFWLNVLSVVPKPPTIIASVVEALYWLPAPGKTEPLDDTTLLQVPLEYVLRVCKQE
jgi:hypothetical protein